MVLWVGPVPAGSPRDPGGPWRLSRTAGESTWVLTVRSSGLLTAPPLHCLSLFQGTMVGCLGWVPRLWPVLVGHPCDPGGPWLSLRSTATTWVSKVGLHAVHPVLIDVIFNHFWTLRVGCPGTRMGSEGVSGSVSCSNPDLSTIGTSCPTPAPSDSDWSRSTYLPSSSFWGVPGKLQDSLLLLCCLLD